MPDSHNPYDAILLSVKETIRRNDQLKVWQIRKFG
jgi:hypothetical protein